MAEQDSPMPQKERTKFTFIDSISIVALLLGVYLVIVVPPLPLKVVLLMAVCIGMFMFSHRSHWSHGWPRWVRHLVGWAVVVFLCAVAIPQFISQWVQEHPKAIPTIHWTTERILEPDADGHPGIKLRISVDSVFITPTFSARCDRPCFSKDTTLYPGISSAQHGARRDDPTYAAIMFSMPSAIQPGQFVGWEIRSADNQPIQIRTVEPIRP